MLDLGGVVPGLLLSATVNRRKDDVLDAMGHGGVDEGDTLLLLPDLTGRGDEEYAADVALVGPLGEDGLRVGGVAMDQLEDVWVGVLQTTGCRGHGIAGQSKKLQRGFLADGFAKFVDHRATLLAGRTHDENVWGRHLVSV